MGMGQNPRWILLILLYCLHPFWGTRMTWHIPIMSIINKRYLILDTTPTIQQLQFTSLRVEYQKKIRIFDSKIHGRSRSAWDFPKKTHPLRQGALGGLGAPPAHHPARSHSSSFLAVWNTDSFPNHGGNSRNSWEYTNHYDPWMDLIMKNYML